MRLATVRVTDAPTSETVAAVHTGEGWRRLGSPDLSAFLAGGGVPEADGDVLASGRPVLPLPHPGKVVCCGLNYADHIAETGREQPAYPTLFAKYADTLVGPDDDIRVPCTAQVDWEAELAVVVGHHLRHADRETAGRAIAGYTVANDISLRDWQYRTGQWFQGKAWDRTTPVGPVVVTPDEVDPIAGLDISCRVNGELVQHASTRTLVFDAAALLAYVSTFTALRPGDLVLTGTPGGVGVAREPQVFLGDGDVVETEIAGIGTLRNTIRTDPAPSPSREG
ncbi:fumarylacetoacetate hydrolase family protein [Nocardioides sp. URHA0032]|uniref:fumarylacetoacetate hydrolase family protein n=1 Tax=Nocardioides sp. URHA0032 TaxID=1380388 RepID=UPI00048A47AA|nr:fumarylacetoacetate hydrolase family protein [Nocardioides sp. URHA0032]